MYVFMYSCIPINVPIYIDHPDESACDPVSLSAGPLTLHTPHKEGTHEHMTRLLTYHTWSYCMSRVLYQCVVPIQFES